MTMRTIDFAIITGLLEEFKVLKKTMPELREQTEHHLVLCTDLADIIVSSSMRGA
jgi:hypothetical protein